MIISQWGFGFSLSRVLLMQRKPKGADTPCSESGHHRCILGPIDPRYPHEAILIGPSKKTMQIQTKVGNGGLFDKVNGTDATRKDMLNGRSVKQIVRSWSDGVNVPSRQARTLHLIYSFHPASTFPERGSTTTPEISRSS